MIDLEELAGHRGSVLGGVGAQPSQKAFESRLRIALGALDQDAPVWLEAESHRIGERYLPQSLWSAMKGSGGVEIRMPVGARVEHLMGEYAHFLAEPQSLMRALGGLRGHRRLAAWNRFIEARDWTELVADLLESHYDPGYTSSLRRSFPGVIDSAALESASDRHLDKLANELLWVITPHTGRMP